jgi:hypothetical protein
MRTAFLLLAPAALAAGVSSHRTDPDIERPLAWLIAAQNADGSWGETAKSSNPDVATTAIAGLALVRMGHTGSRGEHQDSTRRAVRFVVAAVERTPPDEIAINPPGTLPQRKLGRNIDTFVAAQFLAEVVPTLPHGELQARARDALGSCARRIERAQAADGSYAKDGWAPLLASAFANDALYAARGAGVRVSESTLEKGQQNLVGKYDDKTKQFSTSDAAGVPLYSAAASGIAAAQIEQSASAKPATPEEKRRKDRAIEARKAASAQLGNDRVLRGFGSYGGEEHVSYMLTAEAKASIGGADWADFSKSMRARLASIQREDGTWRGDHCITSTTFCTAASLITLAIAQRNQGRPSKTHDSVLAFLAALLVAGVGLVSAAVLVSGVGLLTALTDIVVVLVSGVEVVVVAFGLACVRALIGIVLGLQALTWAGALLGFLARGELLLERPDPAEQEGAGGGARVDPDRAPV